MSKSSDIKLQKYSVTFKISLKNTDVSSAKFNQSIYKVFISVIWGKFDVHLVLLGICLLIQL